jgi:hypothetical protein
VSAGISCGIQSTLRTVRRANPTQHHAALAHVVAGSSPDRSAGHYSAFGTSTRDNEGGRLQ